MQTKTKKTSIKNKAETVSRAMRVAALKTQLESLKVAKTGEEITLPPVTISAEDWQKYIALSSERASLEKQIKTLKDGWGLDGEKLVATYNIPEGVAARFTIINGNGDEQGKGSLSLISAFVMPDKWRLTLS